MVAAAILAFNLALPTENKGNEPLTLPDREIIWVRNLYEKAIGGFYDVVLSPQGWRVETGKTFNWLIEQKKSDYCQIIAN